MVPDFYEEHAVNKLAEEIGYGRVMQLAMQFWNDKHPGSAPIMGPALALTEPCPHLERDGNGHCNWCCGAGRVTKRVLEAQLATMKP